MRTLRDPLRLRTVRHDCRDVECQGDRQEPRLDATLTLACALEAEERVARKGGARVARVGLGARRALPEGRLVAFGVAGALQSGIKPGTLLTANTIVAEDGTVVWSGTPLSVPGARTATLCTVDHIVDDPVERRALAERTGAIAVEMESGSLAATGRLVGAVRAIADGPDCPLGDLAHAATPDGDVAWGYVVKSFVTSPVATVRAARASRRALTALERAAAALAKETA